MSHFFGAVGATGVPVSGPAQAAVSTSQAAVSTSQAAVSTSPAAETGQVALVGARLEGATSTGDVSSADSTRILLAAPVEGVPAKASLRSCGAVDGRVATTTPRDPSACLTALAGVSRAALKTFGASFDIDDEADVDFATSLGERGSATATAAWWAALPAARRSALITTMPGVVGNLEGVPYAQRNRANRLTLTTITHELERAADASGHEVAVDSDARRLTMLQQIGLSLRSGTMGDDSPRSLLSLDTVFPGKAAVAVGDVDTAQAISYMVPGMLYTVSNQIVFWTDRAAALHSEQEFYTNDLATDTSKPLTTATVAWMGYRTPDVTNIMSLGLARAGAVHLQDALAGLDADRATSMPRVNLIAHSYGSTTATIALSSGKVRKVDSLTVLGSPGSVVPKASDLAVTAGHVYAAAAPFDPVAGLAFYGADPGSTSFGATLLPVGGGTDPYTELHLAMTISHNGYFVPGSQSMRNLALIGIDHAALAGGRAPKPGDDTQLAASTLAYVRPQDITRETPA